MAHFRLTPPVFKLTENDVETATLGILRAHGYRPIRLHSGVLRTPDGRWIRVGEPGLPDYVIPQFMLEVKRPGGKLSRAQSAKIAELREGWGVETALVDSVDAMAEWLKRWEANGRGQK